jgi:hypothetical protein
MKFLCVPCDSPMKLQSVGPPERGSLSVVYSCPECGYEMAMLTNAYETQVVQSLGVRIGPSTPLGTGPSTPLGTGPSTPLGAGPSTPLGAGPSTALGAGPETPAAASGASTGGKCPFSAMIPGNEPALPHAGEPIPVRWTAAAEARLANVPEFVRPMARTGIEKFAREKGALEVDEQILDAAREFFGM